MPAAEVGDPFFDWLAKLHEQQPEDGYEPPLRAGAIDWIRFGYLLRHELSWDDTYPAYPYISRFRKSLGTFLAHWRSDHR